jgi:hypothetical protein
MLVFLFRVNIQKINDTEEWPEPIRLTEHNSSVAKSHLKSCIPTIAKRPIHKPRTNSTGTIAFAAAAALQQAKELASKQSLIRL